MFFIPNLIEYTWCKIINKNLYKKIRAISILFCYSSLRFVNCKFNLNYFSFWRIKKVSILKRWFQKVVSLYLISCVFSYILFGGNGDDKLPQSDVDSIDVRATDEQLSFNVTSMRSGVELKQLISLLVSFSQ